MIKAVLSNKGHPEYGMADFINLTFCCQQATVITDFSDLDGYETALLLIGTRAGAITPYGVVYDNGMKLEQFYDYEKYGTQRIERENGVFTDRGYIAYQGTLSLDELMMEDLTVSARRRQ